MTNVAHGRAVLWGQAMDLRSDLAALARVAPALAARLHVVSAQLDAGPATRFA